MANRIFVLYSEKTRPSGKALAKELATTSSDFDVSHGYSGALAKEKNVDVVVNIGETGTAIRDSIRVLNRPSKIALSSNKRGCRIKFKENGIPAPELWLASKDIPSSSYPVVGRTTNHSKGHGFWYCINKDEALKAERSGATHFLRFITNTREFRVHVAATRTGENRTEKDYASIKISEKVFSGDKRTKKTDIIKNRENGWVFQYLPDDMKETKAIAEVRKIAKRAVALFDLDYGAVDVVVSVDTLQVYVLEINSSPRLTDNTADTLQKYAKHIASLCGKNVPAPKVSALPTKKSILSPKAEDKSNIKVLKNLLRRIRL
jgi:carbamoylphosphate synthase large subunit